MRHQAFALREAIALVGVVLIAGALLFPYFARSRESSPKTPGSTCRSHLKQIGLGLWQYAQDYDEKFPLAKNSEAGLESPTNWVGTLQPYIKSTQVFHCGLDKDGYDSPRSSYGYNQQLSRRLMQDITYPPLTIAYFEVDSGLTPSTQTGTGVMDVSANNRHLDGAHYAFADGHVKWLLPQAVTTAKPTGENITFAVP